MKTTTTTFVLFFFVFISTIGFSQEDQIVILREEPAKPKVKRQIKERNLDIQNAFKLDPFRLGIGEVNFSWETKIARKATIELELGPTISQLGTGSSSVSNSPNLTYQPESAIGVLASLAVRYYPLENMLAMNKLYISPRFKYRNYSTNYTTSDPALLAEISGSSSELIFSFNIGIQQWVSNNFAFDFYVGAGIGSIKNTEYLPISTYNSASDSYSYLWVERKTSNARFLGVVGMKIVVGK